MQQKKAPRQQLASNAARPRGWVKPVRSSKQIALAAIRARRHNVDLVIDKGLFHDLIREIMTDKDIRFDSHAVTILQEATETHVSHMFEEAGICAKLADRATVFPTDIQLAGRMFATRNIASQ